MAKPLCLLFIGLLFAGWSHAQHPADSILFTPIGKSGLFKTATFHGKRYFVCEIDPQQYDIELFNKIDSKNSQHRFATIDSVKGRNLVLIVNGGMFQEDLRPLGLYVSSGKTYMRVKRDTAGYGNFYMQPNGIFLVDKNSKPFVVATKDYPAETQATIATQSGPMLVTNGALNGNFRKGSTNLNIRNGVGVNKKGNIIFVTSEDLVNFYEFAELYRDKLECKDALYLDGVVSQYYSRELQNAPGQTYPLGVFIVVTRGN